MRKVKFFNNRDQDNIKKHFVNNQLFNKGGLTKIMFNESTEKKRIDEQQEGGREQKQIVPFKKQQDKGREEKKEQEKKK